MAWLREIKTLISEIKTILNSCGLIQGNITFKHFN